MSLIYGFSKSNLNSKMTKLELTKFLDKYSFSGKFDQTLSDKLFQQINLDENESISIENFIGGFLQFEEDIKSNLTQLKKKLEEKKETYEKLITEIKLNEETCENSKVLCEITDIDAKRKVKGINEIILKVIFNDKKEEFHFKLGEDENILLKEPKIFEFKPKSRNDYFEFIMEGLNNKNNNFIIGNKIFSLTEIKNSEEYLVQIIIPEIDDEKKAAAYINAKIILTWSDKNYEKKKEKLERKIKKIKISLYKAVDYLRKLRDVYGKLKKIKIEKNNLPDLDVYFNYRKKEIIKNKYTVEFNNEKEIIQIEKIQKKEKEEIKEVKNDINKEDIKKENVKKEEEVHENDINKEDTKDSKIKEPVDKKEEVIEEKKEQQKDAKEDIIKEEINDEEKKENDTKKKEINESNVKKEEKEEIKDIKEEIKKEEDVKQENIIKEEKDNNKETKEIKVKEPEEKYIQETVQETIDYESLIPQIEKNNENNNLYKAEQYNEIINTNIQYDLNTTPILNEPVSNKKEEYIEINIDDYIKNNNNNNATNNITKNYDLYQNKNQTNNNYINVDNILNTQNLSQSINKQITTSNTLPVIVKKNVHKVVYDSYVKTLPLIFGGTKVTYLKNNESINYKNNNIIQNSIPLSKTQIITPTQNIYNQNTQVQTITQTNPIQSYEQIQATNTNNTISQIETELKNNLSQSYTLQEYPVQTYNQTQTETQTYIKENPIQILNQVNNNIPLNTQETYTQTQTYTQNNPVQTFNPIQKEIKLDNEPIYTQSQNQIYTQENNVQNYDEILSKVQNYSQISNNIKVDPVQTYEQLNTSLNLNLNNVNIKENNTKNNNIKENNTEQIYSKIQTYTIDNSMPNFSFAKNDSKENIEQAYNNYNNINPFTKENLAQSFGPIQTNTEINNEQIYNKIQPYTQKNPIQINNYNQTYTQKNIIQTNNPIETYNQIQTNTKENIDQSYKQTNLNQSFNNVNHNRTDSLNEEEEESETDYRLLSIVRNYNPLLGNNVDQMGVDYGSLQPTFDQNNNVNEFKKTIY